MWRNSERSLEWSRREVIGALSKMGTVKETSEGEKNSILQRKRQIDGQKYMRNRRNEKKILPIYKNTGD